MRGKDFNAGLRGVLFEVRHYKRMGAAVWLYGWLVLRQTHQTGSLGWVLGGSPVSYREIEEETGFKCDLMRFAGYTEYIDRRGRPKIVAYWVMQVIDEGTFSAHEEIDELQWVEVPEALEMLTYPRDRDLLCSLDEISYARSA